MIDEYENSSHMKWECKYYVVTGTSRMGGTIGYEMATRLFLAERG